MNRCDLEERMIDLTLEVMDLADEMDLTEIGEGVVSQAWRTEYRFPHKRDLDYMTDGQIIVGIEYLEDMVEYLEQEDLTIEFLR